MSTKSNAKQTQLSFAVGKRTSSTNGKSLVATTPVRSLKPAADAPRHKKDLAEDYELDIDDIVSISSDTDEETIESYSAGEDEFEAKAKDSEEKPIAAVRQTRSVSKKAVTDTKDKPAKSEKLPTESSKVVESKRSKSAVVSKPAAEDKEPLAELNVKDPRWRKYHAEVIKKAGNMVPIHGEGQNKVHEILRIFDNSYEYGPCIGVTRLERWNRAKAMGLNPPKEVEEILKTKQGSTLEEYSQSVFYGEV